MPLQRLVCISGPAIFIYLDKTIQYAYNGIGNIASVTKNGVTTTFGYDTTNPDRLISYNGKTIGYDTMGLVSSYDGYKYTWTRGKLSGMSCGTFRTGTESYSFGYDANGQRVSKEYFRMLPTSGIMPTYPGMVLNYNKEFVYDNAGRLIVEYISEIQQDYGMYSRTLKYLYDETGIIGVVYSVGEGESIYYYLRNILGDVIAIYDTNGNKVVEYTYDAWGNCTIGSGTTNSNLAYDNPIRYRGYYYDEDTNLYCLGARYYSPEWRRFISPDDTSYLDPENVNGLNLYCYCNNDPINFVDPSGHESKWWAWLLSGILVTAGIVLSATGIGGVLGGILIGAGAGSLINGYVNEANGGSFVGGYIGGAISGALCGVGSGLGGLAFKAAADTTGVACLHLLAKGVLRSFAGGFLGNLTGTVYTDWHNSGYKSVHLDPSELISSSTMMGTLNIFAGLGSGMSTMVGEIGPKTIDINSKWAYRILAGTIAGGTEASYDLISYILNKTMY